MRSASSKFQISLYALVAIGFCYLAYVVFSQQLTVKNVLLQSLVNMKHEDIKSIIYISGHRPDVNVACAEFSDINDIKEIVTWLNTADDKNDGGHVFPIKKARLILTDQHNMGYVYLLNVYDRHPNDAFLAMNQWVKISDGRYTQKGALSVRVPRFSNWLFSKIDHSVLTDCKKSE